MSLPLCAAASLCLRPAYQSLSVSLPLCVFASMAYLCVFVSLTGSGHCHGDQGGGGGKKQRSQPLAGVRGGSPAKKILLVTLPVILYFGSIHLMVYCCTFDDIWPAPATVRVRVIQGGVQTVI